jgi:hypothetical protein
MCGSTEFVLSGNEIKHAKKKTEGTVTVPPEHPCAEHDDDILPVLTVTTFFGEPKRMKSLLNVHVFWKFPFENGRNSDMIRNCLPIMMSASAPDGMPPQRFSNSKLQKSLPVPPCL